MAKKEEKKVTEKVEKEEKVETRKITKEEQKKSMIKTIALAAGVMIILVVAFILTKTIKPSLEDQLNDSLTKMGEEFYTDFYYTEISKNKSTTEVSAFLEKFSEVGIKVNLDNLSRYNDGQNKEEIAKFKNKDDKACNTTNTKAIIYPKKPYGKNDYTIKVELDCGFETTEKENK